MGQRNQTSNLAEINFARMGNTNAAFRLLEGWQEEPIASTL